MATNIRSRQWITPTSRRAATASSLLTTKALWPFSGPFILTALSSRRTALNPKRIAPVDRKLRSRFNADFTPEKYAALLRCVNETEKWPADFRISETPIFMTREFTDEVTRAAHEIITIMRMPEFAKHAAGAVPEGLEVPNESV